MCYVKPGPRCSAHALVDLTCKQEADAANSTEETREELKESELAYDLSPAGIRTIRNEGIRIVQDKPEEGTNMVQHADQLETARKLRISLVGGKKDDSHVDADENSSPKLHVIALSNKQKMEMARNPVEEPEVLSVLALDPDVNVRLAVAYNKNTSRETLDFLSSDYSVDVQCAVSSNENTPSDTLTRLGKSRKVKVCEYVAANEETPAATLYRLSTHGEASVRRRIAVNPSTDGDTLHTLSTDRDEWVTRQVAQNPSALPRTLDSLSRSTIPSTRKHVAVNATTSPSTLERLEGDGEPSVAAAARESLTYRR